MIARLIISPSLDQRIEEINKLLHLREVILNHPDVLYFPSDSKLGILEARKIKMHFSLKPYSSKGRAVVMEDASSLTDQAQNALLKTLEELPDQGIIILGAASDTKLLPTVLSRCEIIRLSSTVHHLSSAKFADDIEMLLKSNVEQRFEYIEKLKERQEFLHAMVQYFHKKLPDYKDFAKELLQAEEWAEANVNIRGILEYLMLKMPIDMEK